MWNKIYVILQNNVCLTEIEVQAYFISLWSPNINGTEISPSIKMTKIKGSLGGFSNCITTSVVGRTLDLKRMQHAMLLFIQEEKF